MVEEELTELYKKTKKQLAQLVEDMTFSNFYRALQSGKRSYSLKNTEINKTIDEEWVNAIKEAIPHIDAIVNNPRKYMKRETEVVPVEKARTVDSESVRHLASHTNLISSVEKGMVRPNKILTAFNDESLELYENRFVVTLILKVSQFIDRRYFLLGAGGNEFSSTMAVDGEFEQAGEDTQYSVNMTVHQGAEYFEGGVSEQVYADLFMIRKYVTSFKYSPFMKAMGGCAPVRPPISKTNLLVKEPNYAACLKLWDFIDSYAKAGYKIEVRDAAPQLSREEIDELDMLQVLEYLALKNFMADFDERRRPMRKCEKRVVKPTLEDYDTSEKKKSEEQLAAGQFTLREAIDGSAKRDVDEAVRNAIIHALRKEQVKQEMREEEERRREEMLSAVVKEALDYNRAEEREEARLREKMAAMAIRDALKAEDKRLRQEQRLNEKREREVEKALRRQIDAYKQDKRAQAEAERREERERDRLMNAILSDMLKLEEERRYVEENPVVMFGHERVPVPLPDADRLPIDKQTADYFADMFTPPPTLTGEDWEQFEQLKELNRRPRRRGVSKDAVYSAVRRALQLERKREKERLLLEQREREAERLLSEAGRAAAALDGDTEFLQDGLTGEYGETPENGLNEDPGLESAAADNTDERAVGGNGSENPETESESGKSGEEPTQGREPRPRADGGRAPDEESAGGSRGGAAGPDGEAENSRLPGPATDEEQPEGFWHKLFRILFLWWRKKK